jgi:hypothetical protein
MKNLKTLGSVIAVTSITLLLYALYLTLNEN